MKRIVIFIFLACVVRICSADTVDRFSAALLFSNDSLEEVIKKDSLKTAEVMSDVKGVIDTVSDYTGPFKPLVDIMNSEGMYVISLGIVGFFLRRNKLRKIKRDLKENHGIDINI